VDPFGLVRVSVADIRRAPDQKSEQITQAIMGTKVIILGRPRGKWVRICLPDGYRGWIHRGLLRYSPEEYIRRWFKEAKILVTVPWTMIYSQRARRSDPVSDVVIGTKLCLVDQSVHWLRVRLPDDRQGWIARRDTMEDAHLIHPEGGTGQDIVRLARRFRGIPYLWGGLTPKGFDCSGFVQTVFGLNGYALPRDAHQQHRCGQAISSRKNLLPADLLFFKAPEAGRVTHVAIHLSEEQFIHCSDFVRTNSLNPSAPDYHADVSKHYVGARRIVGD
jgi:SH3-like domain-containing protein